MDQKEILRFCLEKGILLDKELLHLFSETSNIESVKFVIENIKNYTQQKILTKSVLSKNKDKINQFFLNIPQEDQKNFENLKIKLGLSIEISKEISINILNKRELLKNSGNFLTESVVRVESMDSLTSKKLEVKDFVNYFRSRFLEMKNVLQEHSELTNLVSIDKISENRQGISLIGIVSKKSITKNKNIIFEIEDLTGKIKVFVGKNNQNLYEKAEEIALDSVMGFKGSGNKEIFFTSDIIFPESNLHIRKKASVEEYALFIGDLHFGSKRFLKNSFLKFIDYLNGKVPNTPEVDKIKYLFIVGDLITGVGNYPNQERDLEITDLEEQFEQIAELLSRIRKDIKIIISAGNHDGVRLMEPQPLLDKKYAWALYELENVILTENPCYANIAAREDFGGFDVLTYHGFSFPYYAGNISSLAKQRAMNKPDLIMSYLLKNRHLAPTHSSAQYFPLKKDIHFIKTIPDIFVAAHTHKSSVCYYNNILLVSTSCWESLTPYQEKFGNTPDHCKVPMFNLKTRAVKILDFE